MLMYREDTNKIRNMQISVESLTYINGRMECMRDGRPGETSFDDFRTQINRVASKDALPV